MGNQFKFNYTAKSGNIQRSGVITVPEWTGWTSAGLNAPKIPTGVRTLAEAENEARRMICTPFVPGLGQFAPSEVTITPAD
jgi:hypothetical protein